MPTTNPFVETLHTWQGLYMSRSMRELEHLARQNGLTMAHFGLLMRLYYHQCFMVSDISDHLGITNAGASQMVQRLVEQGLVVRTEDPNDRRVKQISLSEGGKSLFEQGVATQRQWLESVEGELPVSERETITQCLQHLIEAARKLEGNQD